MNHQKAFAEINQSRLYYEQAGTDYPLVLVHGFGLDGRMWDEQFAIFAQHFRVVRYDLRGFGQSSLPDQPYSHVDDLKSLLDYLSIEQAHLVGLSLGGAIAMEFAFRYPTAVSHLVLANSVLDGFRMSETWDNSVIPLYTHGRAGDLAMAKHLWLSHSLFTPALQNERCREQLQQIVTDYSGWHWLHQDPGTGPTTPTIERLNEIQAPTLVIIGELDLPDFHLVTDMLQQQIPQAQKVILPGAGHMSNMESPERFNEAVLNFLSMV